MGQVNEKASTKNNNNNFKNNKNKNKKISNINNNYNNNNKKTICNKCISPIVIGIGGATRSGKSTLSSSLHSLFVSPSPVICQDEFFRDIKNDEYYGFGNWEIPEALDFEGMLQFIEETIKETTIQCHSCGGETSTDMQPKYIIVEGFLLFHDKRIFKYLHKLIFISISHQISKERRMLTTMVPPTYFDKIIWPNYVKYVTTSLSPETIENHNILILNGEEEKDKIYQHALEYIQNNNEEESIQNIKNKTNNLSLLSFHQSTVVLTGCSSFLGSHILFILLNMGYKVKAIYHSTPKEILEKILKWNFTTHGAIYKKNLSIFSLDLRDPGCCDELFADCDFVIHTAVSQDESENETIMKNILHSCQLSPSLQKLVYTSTLSFCPSVNSYEEELFNNDSNFLFFNLCKPFIAAERALMKYTKDQACKFEIASVLAPGIVVGPFSQASHSSQTTNYKNNFINSFLQQILYNQVKSDLKFHYIDVRDLAYAHVAVMNYGKGRYPAVSGICDLSFPSRLFYGELSKPKTFEPIDIDKTIEYLTYWSQIDKNILPTRLQNLPHEFAFIHVHNTFTCIINR